MGCSAYFYPVPSELPLENEMAFHGTYSTYIRALDAMQFSQAGYDLSHASICTFGEGDGDPYKAVIGAIAHNLDYDGPANVRAALETILDAVIEQRRAGTGHVTIV